MKMKITLKLFAITAVTLLASSPSLKAADQPKKPNILLMVADDLEHPERVRSMRVRLEELTGKSKAKAPGQ